MQPETELERIRNDEKSHFEITEDTKNEVFAIPGGGKERAFVVNGCEIPCDVVFPVLHGTFGEDGTIQGLFEMIGVPYVGCSPLGSAITMDKEKTKAVLENAGIPVVPGICVRRSDLADWKKYDEILENAQKQLGFPMFVKPCSAGSSDGANLAVDLRHLNSAIIDAFNWDDKILIEKAVNAREIECSVTGNPTICDGQKSFEVLTAYGPGEIAPKHDFYDYDAKYNGAVEEITPARISDETTQRVQQLTSAIYDILGCEGIIRIDYILTGENGKEKINLLEINTTPGMTATSFIPQQVKAAGLEMAEVLSDIIENKF